jgi:hypothetical protein
MVPLLLACMLAAGCGASHDATGQSSAGATASTGAAVSRAKAAALAREVTLRPADVPGSSVGVQESETSEPSPAEVESSRCDGGVSPKLWIASSTSAAFDTGGRARTQSSVKVLPNSVLAARNFAAVDSARGRVCLGRALVQAFAGASPGARYGPAMIEVLPGLLPSGQKSFHVRITTQVENTHNAKIRLPVYIDVLGFSAGAAEITLTASSVGQPVSNATERHLLSVLQDRAEGHAP